MIWHLLPLAAGTGETLVTCIVSPGFGFAGFTAI